MYNDPLTGLPCTHKLAECDRDRGIKKTLNVELITYGWPTRSEACALCAVGPFSGVIDHE